MTPPSPPPKPCTVHPSQLPELPPSLFLRKIDEAVAGFAIPPPHHVRDSPQKQLPLALRTSKFVFVQEDASTPSLAPLYRGPYLVVERHDKFFRLQIGSKVDSVSVDCLKPTFSEEPIEPALPPACGRPPSRKPDVFPRSPQDLQDAYPVVPPPSTPPPLIRSRGGSRNVVVQPHPSVLPLPPPPDVWPPLACHQRGNM